MTQPNVVITGVEAFVPECAETPVEGWTQHGNIHGIYYATWSRTVNGVYQVITVGAVSGDYWVTFHPGILAFESKHATFQEALDFCG